MSLNERVGGFSAAKVCIFGYFYVSSLFDSIPIYLEDDPTLDGHPAYFDKKRANGKFRFACFAKGC